MNGTPSRKEAGTGEGDGEGTGVPDRVVHQHAPGTDADNRVNVGVVGSYPGDQVAVFGAVIMARVPGPIPGCVGDHGVVRQDLRVDLLRADVAGDSWLAPFEDATAVTLD